MIELLGDEADDILGESDERYKIAAGNDALPSAMQAALKAPVRLGQRLVALRQTGSAYTLSFDGWA